MRTIYFCMTDIITEHIYIKRERTTHNDVNAERQTQQKNELAKLEEERRTSNIRQGM